MSDEQPDGITGAKEIKPCPYVNGFSSDNSDVEFMLRKYDGYSDFVLFEEGKPARCFRFSAPKRESVAVDLDVGAAAIDRNAYLESYAATHYYPKDASVLFKKRREKALRQAERCAKAWGLNTNGVGASHE